MVVASSLGYTSERPKAQTIRYVDPSDGATLSSIRKCDAQPTRRERLLCSIGISGLVIFALSAISYMFATY